MRLSSPFSTLKHKANVAAVALGLAALGSSLIAITGASPSSPMVASTSAVNALMEAPAVTSAPLLQFSDFKGETTLDEAQKSKLAGHIAKTWQITEKKAQVLLDAAVEASAEMGVNPLLTLSLAGVESSMNPSAVSSSGAEGVMQINQKVEQKTGRLQEFGVKNLQSDVLGNFRVGLSILDEYVKKAGDHVDKGLMFYHCGPHANTYKAWYPERVASTLRKMEAVVYGHLPPSMIKTAHSQLALSTQDDFLTAMR